jgi:hypothetical protein
MITSIASEYVRLVLSLGRHDPDYVDAFYGPAEFRQQAETESLSLARIASSANETLAQLTSLDPGEGIDRLRYAYLHRQLRALLSRVDILEGRTLRFDDESEALYDARAPILGEDHFRSLLKNLGDVLPGSGSVPERLEEFRKSFVVPTEKLDAVFSAAVAESRRRTVARIALPPHESFTIDYVNGKSWSGYNWFKGNCESLIQINTDFPITIDRAVDLGAHEGFPGHHVYNSLLETELVRKRGWLEFSVYALFSPQSLIAEGTANYGILMAYPGDERVAFEREVLFPIAGLDPARAAEYYRVYDLTQHLAYAGNEAARNYLNGESTREQATEWLINYALMSPARAAQRTKFFDQYRSYVINYNLGQDLVRAYIEQRATTNEDRWKEFAALLSSPRLPSDLRRE